MENPAAIFLQSDSDAVAGIKAKRVKVVKGDSTSVEVGASQNKILADISNLHQIPKHHISADQLLKEKEMLVKLLANRDVVLESCKAELQKCQNNFQKLRKQNSELALTNSRMLAELNSSRQRLRELQLELGSKNGILIAMKLELKEKERKVKLKHEINAKKVVACQSKQPDQSLQEDDKGNTKRKRVSKCQSSAPAVIKQGKCTEKIDNRRYSLRRKSAELEAVKPDLTKDFSEVDEVKDDISHLQENLANENGPKSLASEVHDEASKASESSGHSNTEQVHAKKKRHSMRRQSNSFKPENPEPTEDFFETDDAKFNVSQLSDNISEKICPTTSTVTSGEGNIASTFDPHVSRRSSVGRPLRRSVEKIVSYKEVPLKVKMRQDKSGKLVAGS